jgi:tetratricopeptide (TPR) repeat protein
MRCPECKSEIPDNVSLCPQCGTMVEETQPMRLLHPRRAAPDTVTFISEPETPTRRQRLRRIFFWTLGFLFLLALSIGGAAYYGLHQGEREREQRRQVLAEQHYQDGLRELDSGNYELAIAEFEYVLQLDADHPFAQQGIAEAERGIEARPTPTAEPTAKPEEAIADALYQQIVDYYEAEQWQDAADVLTQLRALDPTYEAEQVEEMLYTSLHSAGMELLNEGNFEKGILYLDRAVALRPLEDEETLTQRRLAMQYMTARDYWGVDWERCIEHFERLYIAAPNYQDVFQRLYRAHVAYADAWYAQDEMCPAEEQYNLALQLLVDPAVEQKRDEATELCLNATPTPIPPITGTHPITLPEPPSGFTTGRLAYPVYNTQTGLYDVYALYADGRLMRMASGADQPFWLWGSGFLGYRNLLQPGISLLAPGETDPRQLLSGAGLTWPTFSPDVRRMAYAVQDVDGTWQIYIAPLDGSAEPTLHATGKGPAWGPNGFLAWTGCDDDGVCGIFVDHPDDDHPPTRLSTNINDTGLNWSPDGGNLAYMTYQAGNWDIILVSTAGGFTPLTTDPAFDGLPVWAPDGSGLAFVSNRDGAWGLYLMNPNGKDQRKILPLGPNMPNWTMQRLSWVQ